MDQKTTQDATPTLQVLTRRQVLKGAFGTGLVLLLPMFTGRADASRVAWTNAGKAAEFKTNQPQRVALAGGDVLYITRTGPERLSAVSAKCTHRGCEVGWDATDRQFICPCHGAAFAADGHNLHGTRFNPGEALPALASVPVRQQGVQVQVNLQATPAGGTIPGRG